MAATGKTQSTRFDWDTGQLALGPSPPRWRGDCDSVGLSVGAGYGEAASVGRWLTLRLQQFSAAETISERRCCAGYFARHRHFSCDSFGAKRVVMTVHRKVCGRRSDLVAGFRVEPALTLLDRFKGWPV